MLLFLSIIIILIAIPLPFLLQVLCVLGLLTLLPGCYQVQLWLSRHLARGFFTATGYSFASQAAMVGCVYCLLLSLGLTTKLLPYLGLFLIASIIANIPISLGGLGPRELVSAFGANYLFLEADIAVGLSIIFYLLTLLVSISGVYFIIRPQALQSRPAQT